MSVVGSLGVYDEAVLPGVSNATSVASSSSNSTDALITRNFRSLSTIICISEAPEGSSVKTSSSPSSILSRLANSTGSCSSSFCESSSDLVVISSSTSGATEILSSAVALIVILLRDLKTNCVFIRDLWHIGFEAFLKVRPMSAPSLSAVLSRSMSTASRGSSRPSLICSISPSCSLAVSPRFIPKSSTASTFNNCGVYETSLDSSINSGSASGSGVSASCLPARASVTSSSSGISKELSATLGEGISNSFGRLESDSTCSVIRDLEKSRELLNGEATFFAGLWRKLRFKGVDDSCKDGCDKNEAPKSPFLGDDLSGEFCPGVKFGWERGFRSSKPRLPRLGVSKFAFLGDDFSGELSVGVKLG
ncbi:unnamed protein product [Aspergillus oryzae RIB40]|uniref:DNA, SC023 n=1 Tax=Aspergillus oryzae (strain ATCC 42149 / RIB 40) TaxID=510516 RepID=Q2UGW5_ASPOR|nr:LOW QUALITY PROTEIN: unnamed protein product [Aspergillus oryzae RIB40]BAE59200.1 unnamed protein product [Aspergillus oryzae RIB40]